jgi:glycosyltransferase involved in cell wall biosynthesis
MSFFSIIIPSYNRDHSIDKALEGILNQTFADFEIIIVDDGSTDSTAEIVKKYSDSRIFYTYQTNSGVCSARNNGARKATGDYLIFLDSDDTIETNWLEDFYKVYINSSADIIYCNVKMIYPNGAVKLIDANSPYGNLTSNRIKGSDLAGSWMVKKSIFFEVGMYDDNIKFGENNELRLRFQYEKIQVSIVDKYNFIYNVSSNGGGKNHLNKLNSILYILDKHKLYYNQNKNSKKLFLQSAAVSAIRIGEVKKANELFARALLENKGDIKLWLQYLVSTNKYLSELKWKSSNR